MIFTRRFKDVAGATVPWTSVAVAESTVSGTLRDLMCLRVPEATLRRHGRSIQRGVSLLNQCLVALHNLILDKHLALR